MHSDGGYAFYGLTLKPWLAFLARRTDNYLFHDKTTRQALTEIFDDYPEQSVEFRVAGVVLSAVRSADLPAKTAVFLNFWPLSVCQSATS